MKLYFTTQNTKLKISGNNLNYKNCSFLQKKFSVLYYSQCKKNYNAIFLCLPMVIDKKNKVI